MDAQTIGRCGGCMREGTALNDQGECLECEMSQRAGGEAMAMTSRMWVARVIAHALDDGASKAELHALVESPQEAM